MLARAKAMNGAISKLSDPLNLTIQVLAVSNSTTPVLSTSVTDAIKPQNKPPELPDITKELTIDATDNSTLSFEITLGAPKDD